MPRSHKCIQSWRRRNPKRSREPKSWPVVAAVMCRLVARRQCWSAFYLGLVWAAWLRPSEGLMVRRKDLVRPVKGMCNHWCVMVAASEAGFTDKVGAQDNSVILDVPETLWLGKKFEQIRQSGADTDRVFDELTYPDLHQDIRGVADELGVKELTLDSLTRHNGPSWAIMKRRMDAATAMKRGRWRTLSSVQRYEKGGRMTQEWSSYSPSQRAFFLTCGKVVKDVVLGNTLPPRLPL